MRVIFRPVIAGILLLLAGQAHAISPAERTALIAIYNSTNGANWTNSTNWLGGTGTECTWFGVQCGGSNTFVSKLILPNNNLTGVLPTDVNQFGSMDELNLAQNHITGALLPELWQLSSLTKLDLSHNQLSGALPPILPSQLIFLTSLFLSDNQLSGSLIPELGQLSNLQILDLDDNEFSGTIPVQLTSLSQLTPGQSHLENNNCLTTTDPNLIITLDNAGTWRPQNCVVPFNFTDATGVPTNTLTQSNSILPSGIQHSVPISISNGEYRINSGSWNSTAIRNFGTIASIEVRHVSASLDLTPVTTTLTIAGTAGTFRSTTGVTVSRNPTPTPTPTPAPSDNSPDPFGFTDQSNVPLGAVIESNSITVTGIDVATPISISNGEYRINGGGWQSGSAAVMSGDSISVRHTSALVGGGVTTTTLTIGNLSANFSSTTLTVAVVKDTGLQPFGFSARLNVELNTVIESDAITIAGISGSVPISITNGEYSINNGAWVQVADSSVQPKAVASNQNSIWASGTVKAGDVVRVRQLSSNSYGKTSSMTLFIADQSAAFNVTTQAAKIPDTERSALLSFYANTTVKNGWFRSDGWLGEAGSECHWFGVQCDTLGKHVTGLLLPSNQLNGTVPADIVQLTQLSAVDLSGNCLSSSDASVQQNLGIQDPTCSGSPKTPVKQAPVNPDTQLSNRSGSGYGQVVGQLIDACSNDLMTGELLTNRGDSTASNKNGRYALTLNTGNVNMVAYAKGYSYKVKPLEVAEGTSYVDFELEPLSGCNLKTQGRYKVVILAGGGLIINGHDNALWSTTTLLANQAYQALRQKGIAATDIKYLSAEPPRDLNGDGVADTIMANLKTLQTAITDWAAQGDQVIIYLVDHGGYEKLQINGTEDVTAAQLRAWTNQVLSTIKGDVTLVIDACKAGSFLSLGDTRRKVIASTLPEQPAVMSNTGLTSFSYFFWSEIGLHANPGKAFRVARQVMSNQRVNTTDTQNAQLDANGDKQFASNDYDAIKGVCYGNCQRSKLLPPVIEFVSPADSTITSNTVALAIRVTDASTINRAWFDVQAPNTQVTDTNLPITNGKQYPLSCDKEGMCRADFADFNRGGYYLFNFYVENKEGKVSLPRTITLKRIDSNVYDEILRTLYLDSVKVGPLFMQAELTHDGSFRFTPKSLQTKNTAVATTAQAEYDTSSKLLTIPRLQVGEKFYRVTLKNVGTGEVIVLEVETVVPVL